MKVCIRCGRMWEPTESSMPLDVCWCGTTTVAAHEWVEPKDRGPQGRIADALERIAAALEAKKEVADA
jgi:predicted  nucleic acid-binding Zn-ribbon protein